MRLLRSAFDFGAEARRHEHGGSIAFDGVAAAVLNAIPHPVVMIGPTGRIAGANQAAESFFQNSASVLARYDLEHFVPFGSPLFSLIEQVRDGGAPVTEYRVDISSPRLGGERVVDIYASPVAERPGYVAIMLLPRSVTEKIDRQLTHRGAARTVTGLASMLAHEIKNPLSGIRGAAQLLEADADENDRALTRLICDEADRIVGLVDRMEIFADERPTEREPVNIHAVLERVKVDRPQRFRAQHPHPGGIRSLAPARAREPRPADPGLPESREECRGSHWKQ